MAISSLGVGSSILTQDVIDQLKAVDKSQFIAPIDKKILAEEKKKDDLELIDSYMTNMADSINELSNHSLYDERAAEVTGDSVEVTATAGSDLQDFSLEVISLATKQIEQSGSFTAKDATIATSGGTFDLNIEGVSIANIAYDNTTTLEDLKNLINDNAGDKVSATIIQVGDTDFRLFVSSVETGAAQDISLGDNGTGLSTNLTTGMSAVQTGADANFNFNGQAITRSSNTVDDLASGLTITLKEAGTSQVEVLQNSETIMEKFDSFVEKYNTAVEQISGMTKISEESGDRGSFSTESTIKNMLSSVENMVQTIGGGVGTLIDYGFDINKDGVMSLDKDILKSKMNESPANVEAFFAGGTFTNADLTTTVVEGAFTEFSAKVEEYTKYNATLDQLKDSITQRISSFEENKTSATERLEAKYAIMAKRFAAYDLMISKFSSASSMFSQMVTAQNASNN